ncbi:MAG: hypothetical protein JWL65_5379 [Gammaproteobacteria bacterium]|nr:hypothetical protein [Gammaproteobacteria bacterium]
MSPVALNARARAYWADRERAESPLSAHVQADIERDRLSAAERREVLLHGLRQQVVEEEKRKRKANSSKGGSKRGEVNKERDERMRALDAAGKTLKQIVMVRELFPGDDFDHDTVGAFDRRRAIVRRVLATNRVGD